MDYRPTMRCCTCGSSLGISPGNMMWCEKCGVERPMTEDERKCFGLLKREVLKKNNDIFSRRR